MRTAVLAAMITMAVVFMSVSSCKKYTPQCNGANPSYNSDIKSIIDANCTRSGCHTYFSTYSGLQPYLSNDRFATQVLDYQSMPKGGSLSHDELDLIQCWADNGYPEN